MRVLILAGIATATGCYKPSLANCQYACDASRQCPSGFTCSLDIGMCVDSSGTCASATDASTSDAPGPDAPPDSPPVIPCFGSTAFRVCLETMPTMPLTLTAGTTIDTGLDTRCTLASGWGTNEGTACFITATSITIPSDAIVQAVGAYPLVLVASGTITIDGTLDVSSHASQSVQGAGSQPHACNSGTLPTNNMNGGGAGGSFVSKGGNGGNAQGANGGVAASANAAFPVTLLGGCMGQIGSNNNASVPGLGGGAVYLAATNISLSGKIDASGGGGTKPAAMSLGGGSGGGSGGSIVLWAQIMALNGAQIFANGGGGASGDYPIIPAYDSDGSDPTDPTDAAPGGGNPGINVGGPGSVGAGSGGDGEATGGSGGGGGGGGGAGYIQSNIALTGASVSPPLNLLP